MSKRRSSGLDSPRYFPSLLPIHVVPATLVGASCSLLLGLHGILAALNSTWLGPSGETYTISPSGSGISFFKDHTATICAIATTGAMLCCRAETLQGTSGLNCRAMLWSDFNAKGAPRPRASRPEFLVRVTAQRGGALLCWVLLGRAYPCAGMRRAGDTFGS